MGQLSNQLHTVPRYCDSLVLAGFFRWKGWNTLRDALFNRHIRFGLFIYTLFVRTISILVEVFAYPLRCIFRYKSGKLGGNGWIMTALSAWTIAIFNTESSFRGYWSYITKSLDFLYTLIFTWDYEQFASPEFTDALWQPQSKLLILFLCCFLIAAFIHIIARVFFGYKNSNSWSKGDSIVFALTHKYFRLSRAFCEVLFEPAIAVFIGWAIYHGYGDLRMALYLWIAAATLFCQELADHLMRLPFQK